MVRALILSITLENFRLASRLCTFFKPHPNLISGENTNTGKVKMEIRYRLQSRNRVYSV
jgi:hypothetical protein